MTIAANLGLGQILANRKQYDEATSILSAGLASAARVCGG